MNSVKRLIEEYGAMGRILSFRDTIALAAATVKAAPEILKTKRLTALDSAMSRDLRLSYRRRSVAIPVAAIDRYLADHGGDNPTFGNVREMYAVDCYLRRLNVPQPLGTVLDLGANRGMFSLLALAALDADRAIGVEPSSKYEPVMRTLLEANRLNPDRAIRYNRFIASPSREKQDPFRNVSVQTICAEHGLTSIGLLKMDIEGHEKDLFSEPEWLTGVDSLAMELHHGVADLTEIPRALARYGFEYIPVGQFNEPKPFPEAMFLYASKKGALIS